MLNHLLDTTSTTLHLLALKNPTHTSHHLTKLYLTSYSLDSTKSLFPPKFLKRLGLICLIQGAKMEVGKQEEAEETLIGQYKRTKKQWKEGSSF